MNITRIAQAALGQVIKSQATELILLSEAGSSGSRVSLFRCTESNAVYAVKCAIRPRVDLREEARRRNLLTPHLENHLPIILGFADVDGWEAMVSHCGGSETLHDLIVKGSMPHSQLLQIWSDAMEELISLWRATSLEERYSPNDDPRSLQERFKRIEMGINLYERQGIHLDSVLDIPIAIDGIEYPPIRTGLELASSPVPPRFGVTCHGDFQPSNIVVSHDGRWWLTDWEWAGRGHDWRNSVSHMLGWWVSRNLQLAQEPEWRKDGNRLRIYTAGFLPQHLQPYVDIVNRPFHTMVEQAAHGRDVYDVRKYLALLFFGQVRFLPIWGRESFGVELIARAMQALYPSEQAQTLPWTKPAIEKKDTA